MYDEIYCSCVIASGGRGVRLGAEVPKQFLKLSDKTILEYTLAAVSKCMAIDEIILSSPFDCMDLTGQLAAQFNKVTKVYAGGATRQETVCLGIGHAKGGIILIHDGVRPFIKDESIHAVIAAAVRKRAAFLAVSPKDSVHYQNESGLCMIDRRRCYLAQTPQAFEAELIRLAHQEARKTGYGASDDAGLVEWLGISPEMVKGDHLNFKITTDEDLLLAKLIALKGAR